MSNSIDDLTHNGQTIPDLFELVARCENRAANQALINEWAEYQIQHSPPKLLPPEDGEQEEPYFAGDENAEFLRKELKHGNR